MNPLALAAAVAEHSSGVAASHGHGAIPGWGAWALAGIPEIIVLALLIAFSCAYVNAYRRAKSRSAKVGAGHWIPYSAGILTVFIAVCSPINPIGDSWLLSLHLLQHVLLADIAPALIVLGLRAPLLPLGLPKRALVAIAPKGSRIGQALKLVTRPWVAIPLWVAASWVWAIPSVFDYSAQHPYVHAFEHSTLFYTGLALWWLIIDPLPRARMRPNGQRLALLGFSRLASAFVCVPLMWITKPEYPLYANAPRAFGLSAIADQRLGGASMCFIEFFVFGLAFAVVFILELGRSEAKQALSERAEQAA
ncbi:MAG: cytochrome c oxidase assembly protein [Solirubrobacteraceae bacterium]